MEQTASPFDIKTLDDSGHIEGLLAGFGNVDHGGDQLTPGCLAKSLAGRKTFPMLLGHDLKRPIGAWREWSDQADGLYVKGKMTLCTRDAQEAAALVKDGALTGLSIGWLPVQSSFDHKGVRVVTEAEIFEGSLVAVPMNERSRVTSIKTITNARDIAELLQEGGMSGRKAKAAAGAAWKAINDTENEPDAEAELAAILNASTARLAAMGGK